jgi:hypothetical protein
MLRRVAAGVFLAWWWLWVMEEHGTLWKLLWKQEPEKMSISNIYKTEQECRAVLELLRDHYKKAGNTAGCREAELPWR